MMTFEAAIAKQTAAEAELTRIHEMMKEKYPSMGTGLMGMTPEAVRMSAEYRKDKLAYDSTFKALRAINGLLTSTYKKQYGKYFNEQRDARRAAALAARNKT